MYSDMHNNLQIAFVSMYFLEVFLYYKSYRTAKTVLRIVIKQLGNDDIQAAATFFM